MRKILLVDDDPGIRTTYASLIRRCEKVFQGEVHLVLVDSFLAASLMVEGEDRPDIVLLDLALGDSPPKTTKERLKTICKTWPPIVVLTGNLDIESREECLRNGAAGYVEKRHISFGVIEFFLAEIYNIWYLNTPRAAA